MFVIDNEKNIHLTRGDIVNITVSANTQDGTAYTFATGDVIRFKVVAAENCEKIEIKKDVTVESETQAVTISLTKDETKIGEIINAPTDYWYEIELNPDTEPQTIIGYDEDGAKIFRLYPEGSDTVE